MQIFGYSPPIGKGKRQGVKRQHISSSTHRKDVAPTRLSVFLETGDMDAHYQHIRIHLVELYFHCAGNISPVRWKYGSTTVEICFHRAHSIDAARRGFVRGFLNEENVWIIQFSLPLSMTECSMRAVFILRGLNSSLQPRAKIIRFAASLPAKHYLCSQLAEQ